MIRTIAALIALLVLSVSAAAKPADTMTLAEARRLSPSQLAEHLLGAAGSSSGYVEADVHGNGGIMIHQPGLNDIDLYQRSKSAGFVGLCRVEGVHIEFSTSRYDTPGDPAHRVTDWWKFTRFAMLAPSGARSEDADWKQEDHKCTALAPVAARSEPRFFAASSDKSVDAYFAMRAVAKAQAAAPSLGTALTCASHDKNWPVCTDPAAAMASIPIRQIGPVDVKRCTDGRGWCVTAMWTKSRNGNESREIGLTIRTDATQIDPPVDFGIVAVAIDAGTSIDD